MMDMGWDRGEMLEEQRWNKTRLDINCSCVDFDKSLFS